MAEQSAAFQRGTYRQIDHDDADRGENGVDEGHAARDLHRVLDEFDRHAEDEPVAEIPDDGIREDIQEQSARGASRNSRDVFAAGRGPRGEVS